MPPAVHCFLPIEDANARLLILGSMPGRESLRAGQYYAHPRNAFWRIMGELSGSNTDTRYESRIQILKSAGIAVWDVLASCTRHSSLDADIRSIQSNNFEDFFLSHPHITHVFFNGMMAEKCYKNNVLPFISHDALHYLRLPSTSPAHAAMSYDQKLAHWRAALQTRELPAQT